MSPPANADAWGLPRVIEFFETRRAATTEVYPSEWHFLEGRLHEGVSVLDIGCAQGGFASIIGEHVGDFSYTGLDINAEMVRRAHHRHPRHTFHHVPEGDYSVLGEAHFELVLVLGILHLHETWRDTIAAAWRHTGQCLILDLRETDGSSIEDKSVSYMKMDFHGGGARHARATLPYNILNSTEASGIVSALCRGAGGVLEYGYEHPVTAAAVTPARQVTTRVYCIER
jgi:SAM-dependent methyltransferase